eukprot:Colp12_sorted_trinity150504_noHs@32807
MAMRTFILLSALVAFASADFVINVYYSNSGCTADRASRYAYRISDTCAQRGIALGDSPSGRPCKPATGSDAAPDEIGGIAGYNFFQEYCGTGDLDAYYGPMNWAENVQLTRTNLTCGTSNNGKNGTVAKFFWKTTGENCVSGSQGGTDYAAFINYYKDQQTAVVIGCINTKNCKDATPGRCGLLAGNSTCIQNGQFTERWSFNSASGLAASFFATIAGIAFLSLL